MTKTKTKKRPAATVAGEISEKLARQIPAFDEVTARFLPSTRKRPDRVKLTYKARRKTLTVPYSTEIGHWELQAMAELIERGVAIANYHLGEEGPLRLAVSQENREVLARIFKIKIK